MAWFIYDDSSRVVTLGPVREMPKVADTPDGHTLVEVAKANFDNASAEPGWFYNSNGKVEQAPTLTDSDKKIIFMRRAKTVYFKGTELVQQRWMHDEIGLQAVTATNNWLFFVPAAAYRIWGSRLNAEQKEAAMVSIEAILAKIKDWYAVMRGNGNWRSNWRLYSTADGAAIYVDYLTATGVPQTVTGDSSIILMPAAGGIPAGYDPEIETWWA